ncbi:hypothetical protein Bca52824_038267 [Brassica carinata]|uniref:Uncharacterized protein n=1 Tax=Brassica carinata TaxID=52824 RepID=A0A8X7RPA3_BRACI|nr:hypothetical protein Bca52824_038267 [Brassica carinata]
MDNVGFDSIYSYHLHFLVGLILDHNNFDGFMLQLTSLLHWSSLPPQNPSSLFGMVPEIFVANLYHSRGFLGTVATTILIAKYAKDSWRP